MSSIRWPSLYNWAIEVWPIEGKQPVQPGGVYLYNPHQIFRFTLYWTLVFYAPAYVLCATYAFFNVTFPPGRLPQARPRLLTRPSFSFRFMSSYFGSSPMARVNEIPMSPQPPSPFTQGPSFGGHEDPKDVLAHQYRARWKPNEKRSRVTFALLVFFAFAVFSVAGAVVGSAVIGYVLAGLFKAGKFNMSTWIPFLGGLLQTLVGLLGLWPSVVDII